VLLHYPPYPGASYGPYVTKTSLNCLAFTLRGPSKPKPHRITNTNATKNTPKNTNHLRRAPFGMAWSNKPTLCVKHPWLPLRRLPELLLTTTRTDVDRPLILGPCTQQQGLAGTFVLRLVLYVRSLSPTPCLRQIRYPNPGTKHKPWHETYEPSPPTDITAHLAPWPNPKPPTYRT